MNPALPLVLILNSAIPVSSQERSEPTDNPIHWPAMRESVRPCATQQHEPAGIWSRLGRLEPGTAITVTVQGATPSKRYIVSTNEANLILLDLTHQGLPRAAARILRDMATSHPEYFASVEAQVFMERDLRIGPSGVFLADQKVADLGQVVERISRTDIETGTSIAVTSPELPKGAKVALGVGIGVGICFLVPNCRIFLPGPHVGHIYN
jgi:hypothetical protein